MTEQMTLKISTLLVECAISTNRQGQSKILKKELGKLLSRLEKVFIFRLAVKYGLIKKTDNPIEFYFEKQNKTGKESEK